MTRTSYFMFQIRLFCSDFNYSSCHQFFSLGKVVFNILIFFFPWSNKSMTSHWCITGPGETVIMMCKNSSCGDKKRTRLHLCLFVFNVRWADLPCDEMEERERAGENLGEMSPACMEGRQKTCTIHPLRMNCYKLWLELPSQLGPIRSKPVYLSPVDHGEKEGFILIKELQAY